MKKLKGDMTMTNKEIYKKTLTFSLHRLLYDLLAFLLLGAMGAAGFLLMDRINNRGLIGLGVGLLIGLFAVIFILRYVSYTYKAGQIAMMTKGVTEGKLPENVLGEGKAVVKRRFTTVAVFFCCYQRDQRNFQSAFQRHEQRRQCHWGKERRANCQRHFRRSGNRGSVLVRLLLGLGVLPGRSEGREGHLRRSCSVL